MAHGPVEEMSLLSDINLHFCMKDYPVRHTSKKVDFFNVKSFMTAIWNKCLHF